MGELYFRKGYFETDDKHIYGFDIEKDDRFYYFLKPYISKRFIEGSTKIPIDKIVVKDENKTFFKNNNLSLKAGMMLEDNSIIKAYRIIIDGVSLDITNSIARCYKDGVWEISLGELRLPYHTDIIVTEE